MLKNSQLTEKTTVEQFGSGPVADLLKNNRNFRFSTKIADSREAKFWNMAGKFMGHNPFSREKGYVPNFPDRIPGIPIFQTGCVSIGNFEFPLD